MHHAAAVDQHEGALRAEAAQVDGRGAGTAAVGVAVRIEYVAPGTTYHYKLTATKAGHTISTADATFTTPR